MPGRYRWVVPSWLVYTSVWWCGSASTSGSPPASSRSTNWGAEKPTAPADCGAASATSAHTIRPPLRRPLATTPPLPAGPAGSYHSVGGGEPPSACLAAVLGGEARVGEETAERVHQRAVHLGRPLRHEALRIGAIPAPLAGRRELGLRQRAGRLDCATEERRVTAYQELGPAGGLPVGVHEQRRVGLDVVLGATAFRACLVPLQVA